MDSPGKRRAARCLDLLPSPVVLQSPTLQTTAPEEVAAARQAVLQDLWRRIRYLRTLKGRPPFRWADLEMVALLAEVEQCLERLIAYHAMPHLMTLQQGLHAALHSLQATYNLLAEWLKKIRARRQTFSFWRAGPSGTVCFAGRASDHTAV